MTVSNAKAPLGYVAGIPYIGQRLNGSKTLKQVTKSDFDPLPPLQLKGTLSAVKYRDGMILRFVRVETDGKENSWPVAQAEAELISVSQQGELLIPLP